MKKMKFYHVDGSNIPTMCFKDRDKALEIFKLFEDAKPRVLNSRYVKEAKRPDKSGYVPSESLHYMGRATHITLQAREYKIYTKTEIDKIEEEREKERRKLMTPKERAKEFINK